MPTTEAEKTRVRREVLDRFDGHGPRAGNLHRYSKLDCGHLVDHGEADRIDRSLPEVGTMVCCKRCTNEARRKW
jgi:hypothetical protein